MSILRLAIATPLVFELSAALLLLSLASTALGTGALFAYFGACATAVLIYAIDKTGAVFGGLRIPEKALHLLAVLSPAGCLLGRRVFNHKTAKPIFLPGLIAGVGAHVAVLVFLAN